MLQSATGKRLEAEDRLAWTAFYMDELQRHERMQERGDGMSVIVMGMGMPKNCSGCHLFNLDDHDLWCIANHYAGCCRALSKYIDENKFVNERHHDCPLIEVTTPHGRLILENGEEYEIDG